MRKTILVLLAAAAMVTGSMLSADAGSLPYIGKMKGATENMTPIENAACGRHQGRWCGWYHHRVCRNGHCWCAPC